MANLTNEHRQRTQVPHTERIHPEWQNREIGETVPLHPACGLPVARFEPGRILVLKG